MITKRILGAALILAAITAAEVAPASAQGRGNGNGGRGGAEREAARVADRVRDEVEREVLGRRGDTDRRRDQNRKARRGNGAGFVPPGWCKGVGNPHNTPENCGYGRRDQRDRRDDDRRDSASRSSRGYDQEHEDIHYELDRRYRELAARNPTDIEAQLRLRREKQREHDRWHERRGIQHD